VKINDLYRRDGNLVYIKQPRFEELNYVKKLWCDYETMKEIGGVFSFQEDKWASFYKKMVMPTDGKNFYCLVFNKQDIPVGEVSFHGYDSATKIARFNLKIENSHRGNGYGSEATRLILEYFFYEFGGLVMMDTVSTKKAQESFAKLGFEAVARHGNDITFKLTKEKFLIGERCENKNVSIIVLEGVDLLSVSGPIEIFSLANKIYKRNVFAINTVGIEEGEVETSSSFTISSNISFKDSDCPNILIIPSGKYEQDILSNQALLEFLKRCYYKCEMVLVIDSGIMMLAKSDLIKDMPVTVHSKLRSEILDMCPNLKIVNKSIVDNGRVMIGSSIMSSLDISLNAIKKLLGEEKVLEIMNYMENK
jgi:RimJ/RimL family protein N-acetyltransferase/putative intracellular protease/amidase